MSRGRGRHGAGALGPGLGLGLWATSAAILAACATSAEMRPEIGSGWCEAPPLTLAPDGSEADIPGEVIWVAADHEGARSSSAEWCSVVGPPVLILEPHPTFAAQPPVREVVAGTWNIWVGAADVETFLADRLSLQCSEDSGPVLGEGFRHFALMLQEVHHRSDLVPDVERGAPVPWGIHPEGGLHELRDIVDIALDCGLSLAYVPSARNGWEGEDGLGEDKGNAILSTLPLHRVTAIDLPFEGGRKVAVAASVQIPTSSREIRLDLTTVHLDVASTLVRTLTTGNQTRARQARGMLDGQAVAGFLGHAGVVGGDFNTWVSRDASLKAVAAMYPDSPPVGPEGTRGPFPADHVFFRGDRDGRLNLVPGSYVTVHEAYGSDHKARLVTLAIDGG